MAAEAGGVSVRLADPARRFGRRAMAAVEVDHCAVVAPTRRGAQSNVETEVGARTAGLQRARPVVRGDEQLNCHWLSETVPPIILTRRTETVTPQHQMKQRTYSGSRWEKQAAYSRAIRSGTVIAVSGTTAVDENGNVVGGDVYHQATFVLQKIRRALRELGADLDDVIRTRTFLTDMSELDGFAQAHRETFGGIDPAATCVEVSKLVDDRLLIEIEVDAVLA